MTSGIHPMRREEFRRPIEFMRSTGGDGASPPDTSMRFMFASVACISLGVLTLFAGLAWTAFGGPAWTVWAVVVGMAVFAVLGFLLGIVSRILSKRENQQLLARVKERLTAVAREQRRLS